MVKAEVSTQNWTTSTWELLKTEESLCAFQKTFGEHVFYETKFALFSVSFRRRYEW
jgi:hypothetical protein